MPQRIEREGLDALLKLLQAEGYETLGPILRDRAIVYDRLETTADLPVGWSDRQDGGEYRLVPRDDDALFGYAVGPQSWKKYLFPPVERVFSARRENGGYRFEAEIPRVRQRALIGVRACELAAIAVQDRVFLAGPYVDPGYRARRESLFIVAVNCLHAGGTCFCVSMGTGPEVRGSYDLAVTEVLANEEHYFVIDAGSPAGAAVLARLPASAAEVGEMRAAQAVIARTAANMGRRLENRGIKELLYGNLEHPRWDAVADRCLSCGNCTLACPTCFCSTEEDISDVTDQTAERRRLWDSCFNLEFSRVGGGSVRSTTRARYRQWMTHKLASWYDQFGSSGCVGCGRCITWCPVGIDITEEAAAIRADDRRGAPP